MIIALADNLASGMMILIALGFTACFLLGCVLAVKFLWKELLK